MLVTMMARLMGVFGATLFLAGRIAACDLALALAIDVSGSVDAEEYRIQMQGLASGLRDGVVAEALIKSEAAVAVVQWTGSSRQAVTIPWTEIKGFGDVARLADQIENAPRVWHNYSTAIGEAMQFTLAFFDQAPDCKRRVMDVSGDGISNEGMEPRLAQTKLRAAGVIVNALVIEGNDPDLTAYFWENVLTGPGAFVVTANNYEDYGAKMRIKLRRETAKVISRLPQPKGALSVLPASLR